MGSHLDLLVKLLEVDPWVFHDDDMGSSDCLYCLSGQTTGSSYDQTFVGLHFNDCLWVLACDEVGMALPSTHGIYVPPLPVVCGECDYTYTYDDHARVTGQGDREAHDAHWIATVRAHTRRAIADSFPLLHPRRGAVLFPHPASGGKSDGQVYETNERTIRAEVIRAEVILPPVLPWWA